MIEILPATTPGQLDQVRGLVRAFLDWHRQRHGEDLHLIDQYFADSAFAEELASLPGKYAPPTGRLLLALAESQVAGCVALREINPQSCEMKRMFVSPRFQGQGVGRALAEALIAEARSIGYQVMLLDTSMRQVEAQRLYRGIGFEQIEAYYEVPEDLKRWLVFMKLQL